MEIRRIENEDLSFRVDGGDMNRGLVPRLLLLNLCLLNLRILFLYLGLLLLRLLFRFLLLDLLGAGLRTRVLLHKFQDDILVPGFLELLDKFSVLVNLKLRIPSDTVIVTQVYAKYLGEMTPELKTRTRTTAGYTVHLPKSNAWIIFGFILMNKLSPRRCEVPTMGAIRREVLDEPDPFGDCRLEGFGREFWWEFCGLYRESLR